MQRYCSILLLLVSPLSIAQPFNTELSVQYSKTTDTDVVGEGSSYTLKGTQYFSPVKSGDYPLSEASFVSRASSISLSYEEFEIDSNFSSPIIDPISPFPSPLSPLVGNDVDSDFIEIGVRWVDAPSGWFVGVKLADGNSEQPRSEEDIESYGAVLGKYIAENTAVSFSYDHFKSDDEVQDVDVVGFCNPLLTPCFWPIPPENDREIDSYAAAYKHLGKISDHTYSIGLRYKKEKISETAKFLFFPSLDFDKDAESYGIDLSAYPNKHTTATVSYDNRDLEGNDVQRYGIKFEYFVLPSLSINLSYQKINQEGFFGRGTVATEMPVGLIDAAVVANPIAGFIEPNPISIDLDHEIFTMGVRGRF